MSVVLAASRKQRSRARELTLKVVYAEPGAVVPEGLGADCDVSLLS